MVLDYGFYHFSILQIRYCLFFFFFTENILKYYKIFDMYIPPNMLEKKRKNQSLISDAIDNIRIGLEMDKYSKERKQIGKD